MRRSKKETREFEVLCGLIDLFLESGRPVGSQTLKENGFDHLSSATIRNYFAELERQGYLHQPHASGGRVPTVEAFRFYASENSDSQTVLPGCDKICQNLTKDFSDKGVHLFLQEAAQQLCELTGLATFLSSVRFDHDFILDIKLVTIDDRRLLCVLLTEFGQILTEVLSVNRKLSLFAQRRIEKDLQWRIKGGKKPSSLPYEEELVVKAIYDELMVRYLVRYANFSEEDIFRTGFSNLLNFPEFSDPVALSTGLSLFENVSHMRTLLGDCMRAADLSFWIGSDLAYYATAAKGCSVIAIPYSIGSTLVGAIGVLGPCRMPYKPLFGTLKAFSHALSGSLTKTLSKLKLSFRQPRAHNSIVNLDIVEQTSHKLLEIKESHHDRI